MENTFYIFSLHDCGHCRNLKRKLRQNTIPYVDVDITVNPDLWVQVVEQTKNEFVPCVFVKNEESDEGEIYIPDKDFKNEDELVEILKKYL